MLKENNKITTAFKHPLCALLTALCALYQHLALFCYTDVDNYNISTVLNGIYGDDNICIFVHPFLSYAVKLLGKIFPSADCYALLCWIFMIMAIYASFLFVLERFSGLIGKAVGVLVILFLLFEICGGIFCNFTLQTAFISTAGWLCLLTEISSEVPRKGRASFATVLLCFGLMLRNSAAYLFLPFAALAMAAQLLDRSGGKEKIAPVLKRYLRFLAPVLLAFAVLTVTQNVVLYSSRYADATEYSAARARSTDYPLLPYDQTGLTEISENDYYSMNYLTLTDTDIVTADFLEEIAENGRCNGWRNIILEKQLKEDDTAAVIKTIYYSIYMTVSKTMKVFLLLLLLESMTDFKLSRGKKLAVILAYAGAVVILLYFSYVGRLLGRVSLSILIGIILTRCALTEKGKGEKDKPLHRTVLILLAAFALVNCVKAVSSADYQPKNSFMSARKYDEETINGENCDDTLYIWSTGSDIRLKYMGKDRLPTGDELRHNLPAGDWMYGQNYYKEFLRDIRAENPMKALLYRENTYYVGKKDHPQKDYILRWLREHYDENTRMEIVGEEDGCFIYKFTAANKNTDKSLRLQKR